MERVSSEFFLASAVLFSAALDSLWHAALMWLRFALSDSMIACI